MINKQWIDEDRNPIELPISTVLYSPPGGIMDITMATPQLIRPDIELFVTVTVHDIRGQCTPDIIAPSKRNSNQQPG